MQQLNPKTVWLFFFSYILRWFFVILFFGIWGSGIFAGIKQSLNNGGGFSFGFLKGWLIILPIFIVLCFIWAKLAYKFYRYELTDAGFRKESGVISKKYVTIPYDRIQNIDIYRGILARLLGLSDLHIQTAGMSVSGGRYGMIAEGRLPGLSRETAEQLRNELIQRASKSKNQGL